MAINRMTKPMPAINCTQPSPEGFKFLFPCVGEVHQLQGLLHAVFSRNTPLDAVVFQILPGGEVGVEGGDLHHGPGAAAGAVEAGLGGLTK